MAAICDHYTRTICGGSRMSIDSPAIGLLFGAQSITGSISINDAIDAVYTFSNDNCIELNFIEINRLRTLMAAVYPSYELVGWYTVGNFDNPSLMHLELHQSFSTIISAPIFCLLNPNIGNKFVTDADKQKQNEESNSQQRQLPLVVYKLDTNNSFMSMPLRLETGVVEKISIDQITKSAKHTSTTQSPLEIQNELFVMSVHSFNERLIAIIQTLTAIKEKAIFYDCEFVRRANCILKQLPFEPSKELENSLNREKEMCLATSYLSMTTRLSHELNELGVLARRLESTSSGVGGSTGEQSGIMGPGTLNRMHRRKH